MKKNHLHTVFILMLLFSMVSCFGEYNDRIRIDGSSTLFPLTEAVAEEFRSVYPEIKITVGVSGTSGGFKKFARNEIDITDASRPINSEEILLCKKNNVEFIELPVSLDGIVVAVNKENDFVKSLSVSELKKIWEPSAQGKIKYWNQIRSEWPKIPIQLFGAGPSSGSFDFFTTKIVGTKKASRGDYTASEDDNMLVQGVVGAKGALGYFGLSYYLENKDHLRAVMIDDENPQNGAGAFTPTEENIKNGRYQPLSRTEYLYINSKSANKEIIKKFVKYYLAVADNLLLEVGGIPLSKQMYLDALKKFDHNETGTSSIKDLN